MHHSKTPQQRYKDISRLKLFFVISLLHIVLLTICTNITLFKYQFNKNVLEISEIVLNKVSEPKIVQKSVANCVQNSFEDRIGTVQKSLIVPNESNIKLNEILVCSRPVLKEVVTPVIEPDFDMVKETILATNDVVLNNIVFAYPEQAIRRNETGKLSVKCYIRDKNVLKKEIVYSTLSKQLEDYSLSLIDDKIVKHGVGYNVIVINVSYKLIERK